MFKTWQGIKELINIIKKIYDDKKMTEMLHISQNSGNY